MPLNTDDWRAHVLHRLHYTVRCPCGDDQVLAHTINSLVVGAVNKNFTANSMRTQHRMQP